VVGFIFLAIGTTKTADYSHTISCSGRIVDLDEALTSTEDDSTTNVDARGYLPITVGAGFLSAVFRYETAEKKTK
jgi:hypothetical protein